jgi:hypothetical protein
MWGRKAFGNGERDVHGEKDAKKKVTAATRDEANCCGWEDDSDLLSESSVFSFLLYMLCETLTMMSRTSDGLTPIIY